MSDPIPPSASYNDWLANPTGAGGAVDATTDGLWQTAGWVGSILAAAVVALKLSRFVPVWGPMINSLGEMFLSHIRPPAVAAAKQEAEIMESTAWSMVEALEAMPKTPEIQALKKKITELAPPQFQTIFQTWKKDRNALEAKS